MTTVTSKPWEKYAAPSAPAAGGKPWERYAKPSSQDPRDGMTPGERARAAREGTLAQPSQERLAQVAAADAQAMPGRSIGQSLYDNLIGDPNDGVDSTGEQIGRGINDVARAGAAGISRGVTGLADLPGALVAGYGNLVGASLERAGVVSPETAAQISQGIAATSPAGQGTLMRDAASAATGGATEFRGNTQAGRYAGTVGEFIPGAVAMGGGGAVNMLRFAAAPGVASEFAGQMAEGTGYEGAARVAGALAGGVLPGMLAKGAARVVSPNAGADPVRLQLAKVLDDFGVPMTAGQRVGNEALRRKEGLTGAGQQLMGEQAEAFTTAALKTAGINAKRATPEVLDEAATRIGSVFDDVARGIDVTPDSAAITKLSEAVATYKRLAAKGEQVSAVQGIFRDVVKAFRGGNTISADTLKAWRSDMSKLTVSPATATREAAIVARDAIDDMVNSALTAAGRVDDIARLATARGEWRNFLAIQKAAVREGDGILSPARLRAAIIQQGEGAFARGKRGDIGALARAGGEVMEALPNSGTPAGIRAMIPAGSLPAALGAAIGAPMGPLASAGGAALGLALPGIAGAVRMSRPMQAYLANQLAPNVNAGVAAGTGTALLPFAGESRNALRP